MLRACELLQWSLCGDGVSCYYLKVSNGMAVGEYSEKFGCVSLFACPALIDEAGAGVGGNRVRYCPYLVACAVS